MASSKKPAVKEDIELVIEKLSTNGTESLEANFAKKLKTYCKSIAESRKAETYSYLGSLVLHQLRKEHAQIRFGSLLIIEYLFERAHQFRLFICDNLNTYFKLCADIKGLRDCDYVTENSEDNPDTVESSLNSGLSTRKRKAPVKKQLQPYVWAKKLRAKALECFLYWHSEFGNGSIQKLHLDQTAKEFADIEDEVNALMTQIDSCFDLLIPKFIVDENEDQADDFHFRPMRGLSFSIILNTNVEIIRDSSNADLVDNLRELVGELNRLYSRKLAQFDESINKLKLPLFAGQLNEIISNVRCLKVKIGTVIWKFNEINIITPDNSSTAKKQNTSGNDNDDSDDDDDDDDDAFEDVPDREDLVLLKKIELEKEKQAVATGPSTSKAAVVHYDEDQCKAPLPSGKLCPRRDKVKCPFHGPIVPRDNEGLALDADLRQREIEAKFQQKADEWKDPKYLKQLSLETGYDLEGKAQQNKRKKYPNLVDIKKLTNTPRKRLLRKISSKRVREKISSDLSALDDQVHQQFSQQWSYSLEN
ncbi:hypothetical protein TYRP_008131 [Tyrophagus putrescentiae]|nr:hypothetical protein TYRP_008131 [Tyrophagus putrescentiae]